MHAYQVSIPCVLVLTSLGSEEVMKSARGYLEACVYHGNDAILMCAKFHLHAISIITTIH